MRRRDAIVLGGAVAVALAIPPVLRRLPSEFEFEPMADEPGFRRLSRGAISGGVDPFFGLSHDAADAETTAGLQQKSLCLSLFGPAGWTPDKVPVAIFTDANCPYCKVLERRLVALRDAGAPIRLVWHEFPLLGPSSTRTARATLGARVMGAEMAARHYLSSRTLRPGPAALRAVASDLGVEPDRYLREVDGPRVDALLAESMALGHRLGIPGTPGTVIGRTLVIGAIKDADVSKLIRIEQSEPRNVCA